VVEAVLVAGSEKAAARRLRLSHSTAKHHLANAWSKVRAATTAQLVWILAPRLPGAQSPGAVGRAATGRSCVRLRWQAAPPGWPSACRGHPPTPGCPCSPTRLSPAHHLRRRSANSRAGARRGPSGRQLEPDLRPDPELVPRAGSSVRTKTCYVEDSRSSRPAKGCARARLRGGGACGTSTKSGIRAVSRSSSVSRFRPEFGGHEDRANRRQQVFLNGREGSGADTRI
jgi:hypothetical protein